MIQVRDVPNELHGELTKRAAKRGKTLTAYVQEVLEREIAVPDQLDVWARIRSRPKVTLPRPTSDYVHEARAELGWDEDPEP